MTVHCLKAHLSSQPCLRTHPLTKPKRRSRRLTAKITRREAFGLSLLAFNPDGELVDIVNHFINSGWGYVFHCHILGHEELDMMHAQVVGMAPAAPTFVSAVRTASNRNGRYVITWIDNSKNKTAFVIERRVADSTDPW